MPSPYGVVNGEEHLMGSGGGVKTPPYRRAGTERLPDKGRYPQGCPSSGPAGPPSPSGEGLGAGGAEPGPYGVAVGEVSGDIFNIGGELLWKALAICSLL